MKLAVLGSGPGGYVAAIRAAQLGAQVTVIEESAIGGTCLNWGCIPTKVLVSSSELFSRAKRLQDFGLDFSGEISPNFMKILARKDKIVGMQAKGIRNLFKMHSITYKEGRGRLISPTELSVTAPNGSLETVSADRIILATGSRLYELPGFGFDGHHIISTDDIFRLQDIPRSLLVIGAGASGCEFACIFRQLGSEVTIIEKLPRALPSEDDMISELFERELKKRGIRLLTGITIDRIDIEDGIPSVLLSNTRKVNAEKVLVSAGRTLNSNNIGAEEVGIEVGSRGEIIVNDQMETNIPGLFAIGDITGKYMLAHVASAQGLVAAQNCIGGREKMDYTAVPLAIFTTPEIASVGISERRAADMGIRIRTGHFPFRTLAKSHINGDIEGMIKVVSDETSDRVLGVHMIGPHASDLIHEASLAISRGLTIKDISRAIHAHPTLSEVFQEAAADVHGEAIHAPKK